MEKNFVRVAPAAGFCFGVKRAVDLVYEAAEKEQTVYTYGEIIHNESVVDDLKKKGVKVINDLSELFGIKEGTVIIRSHGVAKAVQESLESAGFRVLDATCPFVKKIHYKVMEKEEEGYEIILVGSRSHPEVEGIRGWCKKEPIVLENPSDAADFNGDKGKKYFIVSQTTFNYKYFQDMVEILKKKSYDIIALNTICNATEERQNQTRALARESDAMIVVGGKESSNTQKLYEICKKECGNTYYIQTPDDLDIKAVQSYHNVGITAGASTPNKIIKEVQMACQRTNLNNCWRIH